MSCILRSPIIEELPALSALCFRSKRVWGYDDDFMAACRREPTIEPCDLKSTSIAVAQTGSLPGRMLPKLVKELRPPHRSGLSG